MCFPCERIDVTGSEYLGIKNNRMNIYWFLTVLVVMFFLVVLIVFPVKFTNEKEFRKLKEILACIRGFIPLTAFARAAQLWAERTKETPPD